MLDNHFDIIMDEDSDDEINVQDSIPYQVTVQKLKEMQWI